MNDLDAAGFVGKFLDPVTIPTRLDVAHHFFSFEFPSTFSVILIEPHRNLSCIVEVPTFSWAGIPLSN
jgi:hypothetical protein